MTSTEEPPSSPALHSGSSLEEELAYYKSQYEQLELELQDFQASSKDLEAELEKDVEASEKRERQLKEKVESLGYEVDEWKTKHKQSKAEANSAQNTLQKEITALRDSQRTLQLKLRDVEVVNDDFERQARNTSSSLEDVEQKYNQAIERGVMMEEELKVMEQEREQLRIETQRLRDELSDLRIEAEITHEKLRHAEETIQRHHESRSILHSTDTLRPPSPMSEASTSATTLSSPTNSTPPSKLGASINAPTPPSPPLSDAAPVAHKRTPTTPAPIRKQTVVDANATPRPGYYSSRAPRHSRGPSIPVSASGRTTPSVPASVPRRTTTSRPSMSLQPELPRSGSLMQIRGLTARLQKLEERVHTTRSKLPAPVNTPPRASPRNGSALGHHIPTTVTVRSNRKRASGSTTSSVVIGGNGDTGSRQSVSRLSFGMPQRPPSAMDRTTASSRPSSRASIGGSQQHVRPSSRSSMSGARTPLGHYPSRPRSSMSLTAEDKDMDSGIPTPVVRRTTLDKNSTGIPTPSGLPRRQSGGFPPARRTSAAGIEGDMPPPASRHRKLSDLGETY
ncbi:hypothetical protein EJ05DRAFT_328580 [Pseudovirgaria hyperparasitica]|uniref:NUDE domain-containing protein n=1 Tax=Pseudovirgaria hyperparasitica TaxID=470096 RepID=A0A6A6WAD8_9PEZI|nr:uncharacterized protein EJ05DRAFT_328580 [Pseudovirgaria hyperparasitica]KAF2758994.1 hypothetical protein EJ05DRAFT_328580 [Pseudovirgaria hyperparasitica]